MAKEFELYKNTEFLKSRVDRLIENGLLTDKKINIAKSGKEVEIESPLNDGYPAKLRLSNGRAKDRTTGKKIPKGELEIIILMGESSYQLTEMHFNYNEIMGISDNKNILIFSEPVKHTENLYIIETKNLWKNKETGKEIGEPDEKQRLMYAIYPDQSPFEKTTETKPVHVGTIKYEKAKEISAAVEAFSKKFNYPYLDLLLESQIKKQFPDNPAASLAAKHNIPVSEAKEAIKIETEHKDTLEKVASGEITVEQAIEKTVDDHLKESKDYYDKEKGLPAMEEKLKNEDKPATLNKTLIRTLNIRNEEVKVYTVNANYVNVTYKSKFPDAREWHSGGHHAGWGGGMEFIPNNPPEIWLDQNADKIALNSYLLHEVIEKALMDGDGMDYESAHKIATEKETAYKEEAINPDNSNDPDWLLDLHLKLYKNIINPETPQKPAKQQLEQTSESMETEQKQSNDMEKNDKNNDKPSVESKQRFSNVKEVDRNEITVMPELFQGRQHAFSEESVNKIVSEGFDKSNDPIVVWWSPEKNKYVVISGHSRWEASRRLYEQGDKSLKTMPVKEFLGDQEEAVSYAVLESNRASTAEGFLSDIKAVKKMLAEGYNKTEMLKYIKPQSYLEKIISYTYLNENGSFIEQLGSDAKVSFPYLERNAQWIGYLRKSYREKLTNQHEKEIFDYLYTSGARESLRMTKENLFKLIDKKVMAIDFNPGLPLNLKNIISTSGVTNPVKALIKEVEEDIKYFNDEIEKKRVLIARAKAEKLETMIPEFENYISQANQKLLELHEKKQKLETEMKRMERETTVDLFSSFEEKSPAMVRIENEMIKQEAVEAEKEAIQDAEETAAKCNIDLFDFANKYSKEVLQIGSSIIIGEYDCKVSHMDSEKVVFNRIVGRYESESDPIVKGYDEIIEMFAKGRVVFGSYSESDKPVFDLMIQNKQKCILYEENYNDLKNIVVKSVEAITVQAEKLKQLEAITAEQVAELEINRMEINKLKPLKLSDIPEIIKQFMPENQIKAIIGSREHADIIKDLTETIIAMPKTYETENIPAKDKVIYLHYFHGGSDWYIAEKDINPGQEQAFGYVILNGDLQNAEWGYINIPELKSTGTIELDFFWTPKVFSDIEAVKIPEPAPEVIIETVIEKPTKETITQKIKAFKTLSKLTKDPEKKKLYEQKIKGFDVLLKTIKN